MSTDTEERVDCHCVRFRNALCITFGENAPEAVERAWDALRLAFGVTLDELRAEAEVRMVEHL